ncbi:MAG TPA: nucleotide exchange factor GrpE [Candidatus Saccharimonadales bacterium]|nr:nucleotide exchange factor GrpE [Candidatus Saccharimonadales bacterium]
MTKNQQQQDEEEKIVEEQDSLEQEENEVNNEIEDLKTRVTELEQHYKRALADYQNLEKRTFEEKREWIKSGNKDLILKLLPVLDILMLAANHIKDQGLDLSIQQFLDVLETEGVKKIETLGKEFDPHTMECVEIIEGDENKVLEELRIGFTLNEKVVRPAQVKVGKAKN